MRAVIPLFAALTLACGGPRSAALPPDVPVDGATSPETTPPAADPASNAALEAPPQEPAREGPSIAEIAGRLAQAEVGDGGEEARAERRAMLEAWLHREPAALAHWELLESRLIAFDDERAEDALPHARDAMKPKPPAVIEVPPGEPWRVTFIFAFAWDTSDDYAWFSNEVSEWSKAQGIPVQFLDWGQCSAKVVSGDAARGEVALPPDLCAPMTVGYLFAREGEAPKFHGHDLPEGVLGTASAYFELPNPHPPSE